MMFVPSDMDLKSEYPELDTVSEFSELNDTELRFVWGWANVTSPYYAEKNLQRKANLIAEKVCKGLVATGNLRMWELGKFNDKLTTAIDRMRRYSSSDRYRAKEMVEQIFDTFETIIKNQPDDLLEDMDKQKKWIDNALNIQEALPKLIQKKEEGFGYKRTIKKGERGITLMDEISQSDDEFTEKM